MEIPLKLVDKYKDHPQCQDKKVLLPILCNQKMNVYIKEITDLCGINKQVSTHVARHTFATLMLANVSRMLGHSDTKMTRHYAQILDSSIMRDMEKAQDNIKFA